MIGNQNNNLNQKEAWKTGAVPQLRTKEIKMGPLTSYSLLNDPKHMSFVLSRYKFCARMLGGKKQILEIGCGDGFGTPIVAHGAEYLLGVDTEKKLIDSNIRRFKDIKNIEFQVFDICNSVPDKKFDGIFSIDVIEHLDKHLEEGFMRNSCKCLTDDGICIIGTPNITANLYATRRSKVQHINLKSHKTLQDLMGKYFKNVFMFGMNDEVIHTGYPPMVHYIFAIGIRSKEVMTC